MGAHKAMSTDALINAPEMHAPLSDELRGSLRHLSVIFYFCPWCCHSATNSINTLLSHLQTKSSIVMEQFEAKQFAIDPSLKMKRILR